MRVSVLAGLVVVTAALGGCGGGGPRPTLLNGQYYMAGDARCVYYRHVSPISIICSDKNRTETEGRYSLTPTEVQQWNVGQAEARAAISEFADELAATNARTQAANEARALQAPVDTPPPATFPTPPKAVQTMCLVNGRYIYCRDR